MAKEEAAGKQTQMIFPDNTAELVEEFKKHCSESNSFYKDILDIEMSMWKLDITEPPIIRDNFNRLIHIFDKLHNKEDEHSKKLRDVLQDVFVQNLLAIHLALEKSNQDQNIQNIEFFKKTIPMVQKTIEVLAEDNASLNGQRMIKIVDELGKNINESIVDDIAAMITQCRKNYDFEEIVEEVIEMERCNRNIIGYSKYIDETIKGYEKWLKQKRKRRMFWHAAASVVGGLALLGLGNKMRK